MRNTTSYLYLYFPFASSAFSVLLPLSLRARSHPSLLFVLCQQAPTLLDVSRLIKVFLYIAIQAGRLPLWVALDVGLPLWVEHVPVNAICIRDVALCGTNAQHQTVSVVIGVCVRAGALSRGISIASSIGVCVSKPSSHLRI